MNRFFKSVYPRQKAQVQLTFGKPARIAKGRGGKGITCWIHIVGHC